MRTSKYIASELTDDQAEAVNVVDDEKVLKDMESIINRWTRVSLCLNERDIEVLKNAVDLMKSHNDLLVKEEDGRRRAIRGFQDSAGEIERLEGIIGGDIDLSTGFACLRIEEGETPDNTMVFMKGELLGEVRKSVGTVSYKALVKRGGKIIEKAYDRHGKAMVSIIMQNADLIAMELVNSGIRKSLAGDLMKKLEEEA